MQLISPFILPVILSAILLLSACVSSESGSMPAGPELVLELVREIPEMLYTDAGKGQKTPGQLSFHIQLSLADGFNVKASTAGTAAKTKTDLTHIKFYLIESTTGTVPTALSGSGFIYAITATNRTNNRVDVTFTNVAANTTGKSYYVATAGFTSATTTAANNITNTAGSINDATEGEYYVSNSGGDAFNPGCVRVEPTSYTLSGTAALAVPLQLLNAASPTLDSDITIVAGSSL